MTWLITSRRGSGLLANSKQLASTIHYDTLLSSQETATRSVLCFSSVSLAVFSTLAEFQRFDFHRSRSALYRTVLPRTVVPFPGLGGCGDSENIRPPAGESQIGLSMP